MKKTILVLATVLLSASCSLSQAAVYGGIAKSVNGGVDWQFSNALINPPNSSLNVLNVSKLAFDPSNNQTVFAAGYNGGLYKSTDSAAHWGQILSNILVYDFAVDPANSNIIYAAGFYNSQGKVVKTTDGGATWQDVYNEASANNLVRSIAINPANVNQLVIGTALGTIVESSDAGTTWQLLKDFNNQVNRVLWQSGNIYVLLANQGLQMSSDGGATFQNIAQAITRGTYISDVFNTNKTTVATFHQVYVDLIDPNLIYLTTSGGVVKTVDGGKTWTFVTLPVKPGASDPHAIAISNESSNIVVTSVDATVYRSTNGGSSWQTQKVATNGYINYILIDPQLPQIMYAGVFNQQ